MKNDDNTSFYKEQNLNKEEFVMLIGIPKEIMHGENRVAATPETVEKFVKEGFAVLVEKGAGEGSFYSDQQYEAAGAKLVEDVCDLYNQAEVILKVKEPLFNEQKQKHEIELMHAGQYLITFIHPASPVNHEMVRMMAKQGIIGLTLDGVPRISRAQNMDSLTSMSTCAGYKGILMAANDLEKFVPQIFCAVGAIKPCNIMVIGVGVAGLQALATAKRLGAVTYAADIRPAAGEQAQSLGAKIIETGVPADIAVGQGGYANRLPEEWILKEREALKETIAKMDVVFCSALIPGKQAPVLITDEMVASMAPGSVIVDISIDQGGNCESTVPGERAVKHGVIIEGIKNIPGMLATSSTCLAALASCGSVALFGFSQIQLPLLIGFCILVSGLFGVAFSIRVGGADMPITISLLNSLSGVAGAIAGMAISDLLLVSVGGVVGASGLLLTQIMCRAMNRSLMDILLGKTSVPQKSAGKDSSQQPESVPSSKPLTSDLQQNNAPEVLLTNAKKVAIVPGYGMALAQAQSLVKQLADTLEARGTEVFFAIHPVAGRMPGHMNVLLCEVDVPYEKLHEMEEVNPWFSQCDVAVVIGANDVINPAANTAEGTPIYGMPVLDVAAAKHVIVCNYDLKPGYAGVENPLYSQKETVTLLLGDAKETLTNLINAIR